MFVAIELSTSVRQKLAEHLNRLRDSVPDARASWVREENLHLTVKFLGNTPLTRVEALTTATERAASTCEPLEIVVGGCGVFPTRGQPRVLWIGIEDQVGRLALLHRALEDECAAADFPREERPFRPHLTLARIRRPHSSRQLAAMHEEIGFESRPVRCSELLVIRSELRSEGSRYTTVSRRPFSSVKLE